MARTSNLSSRTSAPRRSMLFPILYPLFIGLAGCGAGDESIRKTDKDGGATTTSTSTSTSTGSGGSGGGGTGSGGGGGNGGGLNPGTGMPDAAPPNGDAACAAVEQEAETTRQPADIIWALDTSGSMLTEAQAVQNNMNIFAQQIIASGIDVHVVVLGADQPVILGVPIGIGICVGAPLGSGQCPNDSKPPNYLRLPVNVGSWDALNLLTSNYGSYKAMLRPNASKTFVIVTDDNATALPNNSAAAFTSAVQALDPMLFAQFKVSGVFCKTSCLNCSAVGTVYEDLRAQTGGVMGDMCATDFAPVFKALAESVITGTKISCDWKIPPPPMGKMFDPKLVNVIYTPNGQTARDLFNVPGPADCGALGGWYYDDNLAPTKVIACASTCNEIQVDPKAKISVAFGCKTRVIIN